jgi:hypothetical protein
MAFTIKKGDTSPALRATLINPDGSTPAFDLAEDIEFYVGREDVGNIVSADLESGVQILSKEEGTVQYNWSDGDTDISGPYNAEFVIKFENNKEQTYPNSSFIKINILQDVETI